MELLSLIVVHLKGRTLNDYLKVFWPKISFSNLVCNMQQLILKTNTDTD